MEKPNYQNYRIDAENICVDYNGKVALYDANLRLKPGQICGLVGMNGAGKTTILKMLCGLIYPSEGSILVSGYLPFRRKENFLKNITLIMGQKQQLIWDLPPIESFYLNASIYDLDKFEAKKRIVRKKWRNL